MQRSRLVFFLILTACMLRASAIGAEPPKEEPQAESPAEKISGEAPATPVEPGPIDRLIAMARAQLPVLGFEKREAEINGQRLVWWHIGNPGKSQEEESPPVVMIHGVADQAATWILVAPHLAEGRQIFLVDLPGHGESEPGEGPLEMSAVVSGLEAWLKTHLEASKRPVILIGNSMGAWLAAVIAHRHPDWVSRAILINGGPLAPETGGLDLTPTDREQARALMAALRDPSFPPTPDALLDDLVVRARGGQVERLLAHSEDLESHLLETRLGEIKAPISIVWGASDRYLGAEFPKRLQAGLPNATLELIPRCGHIPQVECPAALMTKLSAILIESP